MKAIIFLLCLFLFPFTARGQSSPRAFLTYNGFDTIKPTDLPPLNAFIGAIGPLNGGTGLTAIGTNHTLLESTGAALRYTNSPQLASAQIGNLIIAPPLASQTATYIFNRGFGFASPSTANTGIILDTGYVGINGPGASGQVQLTTNYQLGININPSYINFTCPATTSFNNSAFVFTTPGYTNIPAGELPMVQFDFTQGVQQFHTGTVALQRAAYLNSPTFSMTAAGVFTDAATLGVDAPTAGTNATFGHAWSIYANGDVNVIGDVYATNFIGGTAVTHILSTGSTPTAALGGATIVGAGAGISGPSITITGTDTSGTISLKTGTTTAPSATGVMATITFASAFAAAPRVFLMPTNTNSVGFGVQVGSTASTFTFSDAGGAIATATTTYTFDYFVVR